MPRNIFNIHRKRRHNNNNNNTSSNCDSVNSQLQAANSQLATTASQLNTANLDLQTCGIGKQDAESKYTSLYQTYNTMDTSYKNQINDLSNSKKSVESKLSTCDKLKSDATNLLINTEENLYGCEQNLIKQMYISAHKALSSQNTVLLRQIKASEDYQYTNQQKYVYEAEQLPILDTIKTVLYGLYGLLYVGMLVYMKSRGSSLTTLIIVGLIFGLYPFFIQYFISYIRMIVSYLSSFWTFLTYKNVYQNDLEDTKTVN